jgi:hypothetical protein
MKKPPSPRKAPARKAHGRAGQAASKRVGRKASAARPARAAGTKQAVRPRRRVRGVPPETKVAGITDDAVRRGTGKTWTEWFDLLDAVGAERMDHRQIARYLVDAASLGEWWRQMVTVGYEQARGLRKKHELPDGFQISRSKTFPVSVERLYQMCAEPRERLRWIPEGPLTVRTSTPNKSMRITWVDGSTSVELLLSERSAAKAQLTIQHSKLPSARQAERMKGFWEFRLGTLAEILGVAED